MVRPPVRPVNREPVTFPVQSPVQFLKHFFFHNVRLQQMEEDDPEPIFDNFTFALIIAVIMVLFLLHLVMHICIGIFFFSDLYCC